MAAGDVEKAEQAVKDAAEEMNKQLPEEAQGGSLQPLVEEKGEGEGQPLDTFSVEIDALDQVNNANTDQAFIRVLGFR